MPRRNSRHSHRPKRLGAFAGFALIALLTEHSATGIPLLVPLGTTSNFGALAGSAITAAGLPGSTVINGDIGATTITGLGNIVLNGANHAGDSFTVAGQADLLTAYNNAFARTPDITYAAGFDLAGSTLHSGVYSDGSALALTGTLTLDALGDSSAVWIFQTGSTLITGSSSKVVLTGGALASHVFWQVGSSATLGTGTDFVGTLLASDSITLTTGATVEGRLLAKGGAITLDSNTITPPLSGGGSTTGGGGVTVPDGGSTLGLGLLGFASLLLVKPKAR